MRSLIKRILNEETYWQEESLEFYKNTREIFNIRDGIDSHVSLDDYMWYLIEFVDYPKDNDYKRVHSLITSLSRYGFIPRRFAIRLRAWFDMKRRSLKEEWYDLKIKHVGGDDSFDDWASQIVSMGRKHYEAAKNVDENYKFYSELPYEESFSYAIPYPSDIGNIR
jgi:hypothetical protein